MTDKVEQETTAKKSATKEKVEKTEETKEAVDVKDEKVKEG